MCIGGDDAEQQTRDAVVSQLQAAAKGIGNGLQLPSCVVAVVVGLAISILFLQQAACAGIKLPAARVIRAGVGEGIARLDELTAALTTSREVMTPTSSKSFLAELFAMPVCLDVNPNTNIALVGGSGFDALRSAS